MDGQGCSIPEVMVKLHLILGVSIDSDFHDFVTENLSLRRKREIWYNMGCLKEEFKWLK